MDSQIPGVISGAVPEIFSVLGWTLIIAGVVPVEWRMASLYALAHALFHATLADFPPCVWPQMSMDRLRHATSDTGVDPKNPRSLAAFLSLLRHFILSTSRRGLAASQSSSLVNWLMTFL